MIKDIYNNFSQNKISSDKITIIASMANDHKKQHGLDKTIDGTIGMFYDENEKLYVFEIIKEIFSSTNYNNLFSYSPMSANKDFFKGVMNLTGLSKYKNYKDFFSCVPTSGGLGAIHHSVHNFCDENTFIFALYPYWGPYQNIMQEIGLEMNYIKPLEIGETNIDFEMIKKELFDKLRGKNYKKIFFILNTPASNPTGLSLKEEELIKLYNIFSELKESLNIKIIIFFDIAYIDFTDYNLSDLLNPIFYDNFDNSYYNEKNLNIQKLNNIFDVILIGFSLSKTCGLYGLRAGSVIFYSKELDEHKEFIEKFSFSSRASTGSINHFGYYVFERFSDSNLFLKLKEEQKKIREILNKRKDTFLKILNNLNYPYYRHDDGFFVTYKRDRNENIDSINKYFETLINNGVFFVPSIDGLRVALCSIPLEKVEKIINFI